MKRGTIFFCCIFFSFTICSKDIPFFKDPKFINSVNLYLEKKISKKIKKEIDELPGTYWIKETPFDRPIMFNNSISQDNLEYIFLSDMTVLQIIKNWSCTYNTETNDYKISETLDKIMCETEYKKINQFKLEINSIEATLKDGKLIVTNKLNKSEEIYVLSEVFLVKTDPIGFIP